jgi:ubiquinone/menaquinone biosynthesis C-methylase UbiE
MHETTTLWHDRFKDQLQWTKNTRDFIYRKLQFAKRSDMLELGCGTGALLEEVASRFVISRINSGKAARLVGIDHDPEFVRQARYIMIQVGHGIDVRIADASDLPFDDSSFEIVYCHYFLMWNDEQKRARIIKEAKRVLKDDGWFICFAEPDYVGWILEPERRLRELLVQSLLKSGGDIESGRKLVKDLASFHDVVIDCSSKPWTGSALQQAFETEWNFYENLLAEKDDMVESLAELKKQDLDATLSGIKFSFLPVFFGFGRK